MAIDSAQEDYDRAGPFPGLATDGVLKDQAARGGRRDPLWFRCLSIYGSTSAAKRFSFFGYS